MMQNLVSIPLATCLLASAVFSQQLIVNVDVGNGGSAFSGQGAITAANPADVFWNAIWDNGSNLLAPDGVTPTGIDVSIMGDNVAGASNSNDVMADYVYVAGWASTFLGDISITGLTANTDYLICVYSAGGQPNEAGVITLNGVTGYTNGSLSTQFVEGDNYTLLKVRSDGSGAVTGIFDPLDTVAVINGLQIAEGHPPAKVVRVEGAESPTVRLPGATVSVQLTFDEEVTLSQSGGAAIDLDVEGTPFTAVHTGATTGRSLTFETPVSGITTADVRVVQNSLRLLGASTLVGSGAAAANLALDETPLPNDQISTTRLSTYPGVPSLSAHESAHYSFRVREVGGPWQPTFAWFTKCVDNPSTEYGYYADQIGGWSHSYCNFEMAENVPIEVEITRLDPATMAPVDITSAVPHPRRKVKSWRVEGGKAYVMLERPALFAVDIDRQFDDYITSSGALLNANALHGVSVFANPVIVDKPDPNDPDVEVVQPGDPVPTDGPWSTLYFAPGVHQLHTGTWAFGSDFPLRSNKSYYIPGDAIVHGNMNNENNSANAQNIRIFGHGTLSGERIDHPIHLGIAAFEDQLLSSPIRISNGAKGCRVEGITVADPAFHACIVDGDYNGRRDDYNYTRWTKILGWRANSDGITPNGTSYLEDCFIRTQDDGSYITGLGIRRMVYWHDVNGMPLRCSQLLKQSDAVHTERPLVVEDIDVIYARTFFGGGTGRSVIGYPDPDSRFPGTTGAHVVFRDVQVEDLYPTRTLFGWGLDEGTGMGTGPMGGAQPVFDVLFENVRAAAANLDGDPNTFNGDVDAPITGLRFDDVRQEGQHFDELADFSTNSFVGGFVFSNTAPAAKTFRNSSGYGKWHMNDDWDGAAEPSDNDLVQHTAVSGLLEVDAPAYAGDLDIAHAGTATVAVRSDGHLRITGTLSIGATGSGALELRDGSLELVNSAAAALSVGSGAVHIEQGELLWTGDHVGDIQSLHTAGALTFSNGRQSNPATPTATLIAQDGQSSLYASYDSVEDRTTVFVVTTIVYGSGCGAPALSFTPDQAGQPSIGQNVSATVSNAPTAAGGVFLGFSNQNIGGAPLPLPLDIIGLTGCSLLQSAELSGLAVTPLSASSLRYSLALPSDPGLIDVSIYLQAYALAPGVNPLGLVLSNGIAWTITDV